MVRISLSHLTLPSSIPQLAALGFLVSLGGAAPAQAQKAADAWKPEGNVEFVVGAGAGGENDRIARAIAHALGNEHLVDSMTVLNRPGAAQTIAMQYLASKKGDASAIGLASGSFINADRAQRIGLAQKPHPADEAVRRLSMLLHQGRFPQSRPWSMCASVCGRTRSSLTFAFPVGLGTPLHVSVVSVGKAAGAAPNELITVVYNSGSDVAAQIAGGHVDIGITSIGSAMPLIAAGRLRMLGIASPERIGGVLQSFRRCANRASMWSPPIRIPCWHPTGLRLARSISGHAPSIRYSWIRSSSSILSVISGCSSPSDIPKL